MATLKALIAVALAFAATLAQGLPTAQPAEAAENIHIINGYFAMCPGTLWAGDACKTIRWTSEVCYEVPPALNTEIQSASPTAGSNGVCALFHDDACRDFAAPLITYPGIDNFETSGLYSPFRSWKCDCGMACVPSVVASAVGNSA